MTTKFRLSLGLILMLGALTAAAASASAAFMSQSSETKGKLKTGTATFGEGLACSAGTGTWTIIDGETGKAALKGNLLNQAVAFEGCTVKIAEKATKVEPFKCEFQIAEGTEKGKGTESVLAPCTLKAPAANCEIKIPATKGLEKSSWFNSGTNLEIANELKGVEENATEQCARPKIIIIIFSEGQVLIIFG